MVGYITHNCEHMGVAITGGSHNLNGGGWFWWSYHDLRRMDRLLFNYRKIIDKLDLDTRDKYFLVYEIGELMWNATETESKFLESLNANFFRKWATLKKKDIMAIAGVSENQLAKNLANHREYKKLADYINGLNYIINNPNSAVYEARQMGGHPTDGWIKSLVKSVVGIKHNRRYRRRRV